MTRPFRRNYPTSLKLQLISEHPLGLITSTKSPLPLPFVAESEGDNVRLLAHLSCKNPLVASIDRNPLIDIVFSGPNRYISPTEYHNPLNVPTWNYSILHVTGRGQIVRDQPRISQILNGAIAIFEARHGTDWNNNLPEDFRQKLLGAIVGLEVKVVTMDLTLKLSQNRNAEDYESLRAHMSARESDGDRDMLTWMNREATVIS